MTAISPCFPCLSRNTKNRISRAKTLRSLDQLSQRAPTTRGTFALYVSTPNLAKTRYYELTMSIYTRSIDPATKNMFETRRVHTYSLSSSITETRDFKVEGVETNSSIVITLTETQEGSSAKIYQRMPPLFHATVSKGHMISGSASLAIGEEKTQLRNRVTVV